MFKKLCQTALLFSAFSAFNANASLIEVDVELQLLTDVSGSVNSTEYELQREGYISAFRNLEVINTILAGTHGSIAVQYVEWASSTKQTTQVDWFLIDSVESANAFADELVSMDRAYEGRTAMTAIGSAISYGAALFDTNNYTAEAQVIDVSGDGIKNSGKDVAAARDEALALGVDTINGITIGNATGLQDEYINNVIGGEDAFHLHASSFDSFETGIQSKLTREISDANKIPEPSSIALMGFAVLGLFGASRKRTAKK